MKIIEKELLVKHTTFRLGGEAKYFCEVENIDELKQVLSFAKENNLSYFILGGGSNVVADDNGYSGLVIKMKSNSLKIEDTYIEVNAGVNLATVISESLKNGLLGLEWAWGIPGTVGGAVRGNAGAYGGEISDSIENIKVLRNGETIELKKEECEFNYRESIFKKNKDIILSVRLKLKKGSEEELERAKENLFKIKQERIEKFTEGFSAGSFFKNILMGEKEIQEFKNKHPELPDQFVEYEKIPSAWLIDRCDLKGFCVGDICVSEKHAGIIVNRGKGISDELLQLVSLVKTKVRDRFGIELQEEVQYLR